MIEESKYYTPKLEELNSEFEFELYSCEKGIKFHEIDGWYPSKIDFGVLGELKNLAKLLFDDYIRVKILDEKDILECGWELFSKDKCPMSSKILNCYKLNREHGFNTGVNYFLKDNLTDFIISSESYSSYKTYNYEMPFKLKNKNELRILMKQIGI